MWLDGQMYRHLWLDGQMYRHLWLDGQMFRHLWLDGKHKILRDWGYNIDDICALQNKKRFQWADQESFVDIGGQQKLH